MSPQMKRYWNAKLEKFPEVVVKKALASCMDTKIHFPKWADLLPILMKFDTRTEFIKYNKASDSRFPVSLMWKAFKKLSTNGNQQFEKYCESVNMPTDDKQRVIQKYKMAYSFDNIVNNVAKGTDEKTSLHRD